MALNPTYKMFLLCHETVLSHLKCDLCDTSYVGYTLRHLHQRGDEHKDEHKDQTFSFLKYCHDRIDCLLHEMLLIE